MLVITTEPKCVFNPSYLAKEDLAKISRRVSHEDAETFEELSRQATRYQAKLDIYF